MNDFLNFIESAAAEVPENLGKVLHLMGDEIAKLGGALEALAARMDKLDHEGT